MMTSEKAIQLLHRLQDEQFDGIHGDERREALRMAVRALETDGDLVSRQAAITTAVRAAIDWHRLANPQYSIAYCIGEAMRQLPSAQPETAKRIVGKSRDGMTLWYQCNMCNEPVDAQDDFCRGCGRRLTDG